ncbi:hypothetical protein UA08_03665 [Talaromyces atroroseus]|uniref:Major facilitator superfamily (MFS) profile domain-containing protein n=1 Tax=Talaromyces atroroseus TaxID=1441469 RepID=A0A225AKV7_TALAT|nr:hypothetical protein UA08_03665 [Talaromyces atroroseus]OKL61520.1 hypothetical protein UA08_03665 [Talaromyces atroroseus]
MAEARDTFDEKTPSSPVIADRHVDERILEHSHDADVALQALQYSEGQVVTLDEATNKRLLRIIDWHLMPLMCVVYGLNYLDKTTISYASIMGLETDLHLVGNQYEWLGSMFYFGYLGWEYGANQLLQRMPLGKYSAVCIILWGMVLSCFAAVDNFGGAVAIRLFLGVCEASVTPGFALLTSQWYTRTEQGQRTGLWFSFNGFGQIIGGAIAYGIAVGTEKNGSSIAPWKIIFLATGLCTVCVGFLFLWVIPDNQLNARWLSPEDRILAIERVRINQQGIGNKHFKMYQFKEALTDPMTWAFAFYSLVADIPNGGISNFFSQLIENFGYTETQSLLYGIPGGAVEVIALIASGFMGDWLGRRLLCSMGGLMSAMIGMILIIALPMSNNTGPQTFRPQDAPRYVPAEITIVVCYGVCLLDLAFIWWWYDRQNKKKALIRASADYAKMENQEWLDLTDGENAEFVYTL